MTEKFNFAINQESSLDELIMRCKLAVSEAEFSMNCKIFSTLTDLKSCVLFKSCTKNTKNVTDIKIC